MITEQRFEGSFVALGAFDGLHLGHKAVITAEKSQYERKLALMVRKNLIGTDPESAACTLITPQCEREILFGWGVEPVYVDFGEICNMTPQEFVDKILVEKYNARSIACGFNYRFGKGACGDVSTLMALCLEREIKLTVVDKIEYNDEPISSTRIREAVSRGDMKSARAMLGRYFSYEFEVLHGDERGRTLGSPTINQFFTSGFQVPEFGVYASFTEVEGRVYPSVTNIGIRPTIGNSEKRSETNIIGFNGDLYGQYPRVFLVEKIRGEMNFGSLEELKNRIFADRETALTILKGENFCEF
ncbi:MAG: riboflavin biosynthesis protein RibF [Clostridia bacterium]|nr:riboflavin biosynthesis protein RibF [Clostridia bacterium]